MGAKDDRDLEAEITRLMDDYGDMLVGLCAGLLADPDLAQDIAQETFLRAYRSLRRFDGRSEKAWLTRIAVNLCRDQWKSRWFRHVDRRVTPDMLPEPSEAADESAEGVLKAVQALPGPLREVIVLRYFEDMKVEEVTKALGISPTTLYKRLEMARQALRGLLEGESDDA